MNVVNDSSLIRLKASSSIKGSDSNEKERGPQPEKSSGGLRGRLEGHGTGNALGITSNRTAVTKPPRGALAYNNVVNDASTSAIALASKALELVPLGRYVRIGDL